MMQEGYFFCFMGFVLVIFFEQLLGISCHDNSYH